MEPVSVVSSVVCPIDANDIDTDQIIPKQFLKRLARTGYGPFAFYGWRYDDAGLPVPDFPMNRPEYERAAVLLTGRNFGCGSSREHAAWALMDFGFKAIIAPSFGDIFRNNCAKTGILCVEVSESTVRRLFDFVNLNPTAEVTVDLPEQRVTAGQEGAPMRVDELFEIDPHTKKCLLEGLDDITLSLKMSEAIEAFEATRPTYRSGTMRP